MMEVWVDPNNGMDTNPGTQAAPFKTMQAALAVLCAPATMHLMAGIYTAGIGINGPITGQKTPDDLKILGCGTAPTYQDCMILPPTGHACLTLAWGASCSLGGVLLNGSCSNQDLIQVGQYSTLWITQPMCFGPASNPANHMSIGPGGAGLMVMADYNLWLGGHSPQCHIDIEDGWTFFANTNPGYFVMNVLDSTPFVDAFIHCAGARVNIQGVSWVCQGGPLHCKTCIVEKNGYVDTGTSNDFANPGNPNYFPGTINPIVRGNGIYC